jgi:hypothetical protein
MFFNYRRLMGLQGGCCDLRGYRLAHTPDPGVSQDLGEHRTVKSSELHLHPLPLEEFSGKACAPCNYCFPKTLTQEV